MVVVKRKLVIYKGNHKAHHSTSLESACPSNQKVGVRAAAWVPLHVLVAISAFWAEGGRLTLHSRSRADCSRDGPRTIYSRAALTGRLGREDAVQESKRFACLPEDPKRPPQVH